MKSSAPIQKFLLSRRFNVGRQSRSRLAQSLRLTDKLHLLDKTLLTPSVHDIHADALDERFQRKWTNVLEREHRRDHKSIMADLMKPQERRTDHQISDDTVRFLTLVDSVVPLSKGDGLRAARLLKGEIEQYMARVPGVACLGALEIEVISIKMMRRVHHLKSSADLSEIDDQTKTQTSSDPTRFDALFESSAEDERSKLEVCERLGGYLDQTVYAGETGQLLVHFHAIVTAGNSKKFDQLMDVLRSNPRWNQCPAQIRLAKLSRTYCKKEKPVSRSLKDFARYFTKGGNDWNNNRSYLNYKLAFNNAMPLDQDEWFALNWRSNEIARQEHEEEGTTDVLSLNREEISVLAQCIHEMMNWNTRGTGYLVTVGRW